MKKIFRKLVDILLFPFTAIAVIFGGIAIISNFLFTPKLFQKLTELFPQLFSKKLFILLLILILAAGGVFAWQYFGVSKMCADSDDGNDSYVKGFVTGKLGESKNVSTYSDFCSDENWDPIDFCGGNGCYQVEYICGNDGKVARVGNYCQYGCSDGACRLVPEEISQDETANWQIYKNEEYRFEIKYPHDYFVQVSGERKEGQLVYNLLQVDIYQYPKISYDPSNTPLFTVNVVGPDFILGSRNWENFSIGGIDGDISYTFKADKLVFCEIIFTSNKGQMFHITTANDPLKDENTNQMLSTFKFLE